LDCVDAFIDRVTARCFVAAAAALTAMIAVAITFPPSRTSAASAQASSDPRVADLVAAGRIRAGLGIGNHAAAFKDPATGELQGMATRLARALAEQIGIALEIVQYPRPGAVFEGAQNNAWDVTFLVVDPQRTAEADATPPYMQSEFTFLVPAGSAIRTIAEADRPGIRICVPRGDAVDLSLSRIFKLATLVRADSQAAGIALLRSGAVNAYAAPRSALLSLSAQVPRSHVLEDAFATTSWAGFVPKGHDGRLGYVTDFVENAKADGLVARLIAREGLRGIEVTPPAKQQSAKPQ
jgi:polar amino acid transport system substrate-binding protein